MFSDLKDGRKLLDLLEGLTGNILVSLCMCVLRFAPDNQQMIKKEFVSPSNLWEND